MVRKRVQLDLQQALVSAPIKFRERQLWGAAL